MDASVLGTIIGIVALIIMVLKIVFDYRKKQVVNWKTVLKYVEQISEKLRSDDKVPDLVISFPKGGLIVADLLGHCFENKIDIISIHTERYVNNSVVGVKIRSDCINFEFLKNKNILIIDDVLENGRTILQIVGLLKKNGIQNEKITTAVLGKTPISASVFKPDYYCFEYHRSESKDFYLPWGKVTL